jgi:KaiC/GvpD/RAD55 family RecA-like ATPase
MRASECYVPSVPFFRTLFLPHPRGGNPTDIVGFPSGSSMLITGRPGVGKAFFTLALVRALMRSRADDLLYYVGVGMDRAHLCSRFDGYGWFQSSDNVFLLNNRAHIVEVRESDLPHPSRGAEEIINPAMAKVRRLAGLHRERKGKVFVVVDSLTAFVKDSRDRGDRRRNIHEMIDRLAEALGDRLALNIMIAEADEPDVTPEAEHIADFVLRLSVRDIGFGRRARAVEVVKYLDGTPMLLGSHSWDVLSPASLSHVVASDKLRESIGKYMSTDTGTHAADAGRWGTILVAPYPRLPAIGDLQSWHRGDNATASQTPMSTGTPGLDEMLGGDSRYWARPVSAILDEKELGQGRLYHGSTTLLLGRSGTGKTICCLQFLLAEVNPKKCLYVNFENRPQRVVEWFPGDEKDKEYLKQCHTLYRRRAHLDLNFLVSEINNIIRNEPIERVAIDGLSDLLTVLEISDYSRLAEDLFVTIRNAYQARINGESRRRQEDKNEKQNNLHITILLTLEADDSPDVLSRFDADSYADNVLVLKQITLNDEQRKTIRVLKARGNSPDRMVREIVVLKNERYPLRIIPGLENYRNLSAKVPEPVRVTLQLIEENEAERLFNKRLKRDLNRLFGYDVTQFGFARDEITRTLLDIASNVGRIPYSDIKLLNIDEWWVRELRLPGRREPGKSVVEQLHPLLQLNAFLSLGLVTPGDQSGDAILCSDFWVFEMEKASVPLLTERGPEESSWELSAEVVALPSYLDFGLFCVHKPLALALGLKPSGPEEGDGPAWLDAVPLRWAQHKGEWFESPTIGGEPKTLVDLMARLRNNPEGLVDDVPNPIGFAFDMETTSTMVCTFLELCWGFGASEDFLIQDLCKLEKSTEGKRTDFLKNHPATAVLRFLAFLVLEGLMPPRTSLADTRRSLFSRHWLSSLTDIDPQTCPNFPSGDEEKNNRGKSVRDKVRRDPLEHRKQDHLSRSDKMILHPVPFFPVGSDGRRVGKKLSPATRHALIDALRRFDRLLARVYAAVDYRKGLLGQEDSVWGDLLLLRRQVGDYLKQVDGLEDALLSKILDFLGNTGRTLRDAARKSALFRQGRGVKRRNVPSAQWRPVFPHPDTPIEQPWRRLPAALFIDLRDLLLLLDWHEFRLALLRGERDGRPLSAIVRSPGTPAQGKVAKDKVVRGERVDAVGRDSPLTGYACEGSWLVAVERTTRSPSLAVKFLTEMTSAAQAENRGAATAGIPARKSFFDFHGDDPVPCFPAGQMSWNTFLRLTGARARRRDRTFCSRIRVSDLFTSIQQMIQHTLVVASEFHGSYRNGGEDERKTVIETVSVAAERAVADLFELVRSAMVQAALQEARTVRKGIQTVSCKETQIDGNEDLNEDSAIPDLTACLLCPDPSACRKVLQSNEGPPGA